MKTYSPTVYTIYTFNELHTNLGYLRDKVSALSFEAGVILGERDALAFALRDILTHLNGDLLAVMNRHRTIIDKVLND